jgi:hypothetical protein
MRLPFSLLIGFCWMLCAGSAVSQDEDVYLVTSKLSGRWPIIGGWKHISVAICPKGVSPVAYKNGVAVSNNAQCRLYGTRTLQRGFVRDGERVGVSARRITGVSASVVEQRVKNCNSLNIPLINDCRHQAAKMVGTLGNKGPLGRLIAPVR